MIPYDELVKELNIANGIIVKEETSETLEYQEISEDMSEESNSDLFEKTVAVSYNDATAVPSLEQDDMQEQNTEDPTAYSSDNKDGNLDVQEQIEDDIALSVLEDEDSYYSEVEEENQIEDNGEQIVSEVSQAEFEIIEEDNISSKSGELDFNFNFEDEKETNSLDSIQMQDDVNNESQINMGIEGFDVVEENNYSPVQEQGSIDLVEFSDLPTPIPEEEQQDPSMPVQEQGSIDLVEFSDDSLISPHENEQEYSSNTSQSQNIEVSNNKEVKKTMMGMPAPNIDPTQWVQQSSVQEAEDYPPPPPPPEDFDK